MNHWKTQFNYKWLGAYCLPEGKDLILTIKEMKRDDVVGNSGKKEKLLIAYFVEDVKPMVVNKTNCRALEQLFKTPMIEDWVGKQIQVGASRVEAFGETVDSLRVRKFIPNVPKQLIPVTTGSAIWKNIVDGLKSGYTLDKIEAKYKLSAGQKKELKQYEVK